MFQLLKKLIIRTPEVGGATASVGVALAVIDPTGFSLLGFVAATLCLTTYQAFQEKCQDMTLDETLHYLQSLRDENQRVLTKKSAAARLIFEREAVDLGGFDLDQTDDAYLPHLIFYQFIAQRFDQADGRLDGLEAAINQASGELRQRIASLLLQQSNDILRDSELTREELRDARRELRELVTSFSQEQQQLLQDLQANTQHCPRLSLDLYAYDPDRVEQLGINRFFYARQRVPLYGRERDFARLADFLDHRPDATPDLKWWLWTGPGGAGKSRLALELCLHARQLGYVVGFLDEQPGIEHWDRWRIDQPTLIVVDYAARRVGEGSRATMIRDAVGQLFRHHGNARAPVRFLLLERSADDRLDQWWQQFNSQASSHQREAIAATRFAEPWELPVIDDDAIWSIFQTVFAEIDFDPPDREAVVSAMRAIDPLCRPLFVALAAETVAEHGSVQKIRDWSKDTLAEHILQREVDRWNAIGIDEAHANLLAFVTITGRQPTQIIDELHAAGLPVPSLTGDPLFRADWYQRLTGLSHHESDDELPPLEPDPLGELFVLERLEGNWGVNAGNREQIKAGTNTALEHASEGFVTETFSFLARGLGSFPDHPASEQILAATKSSNLKAVLYEALANAYFQRADIASAIQLLDRALDPVSDMSPAIWAMTLNNRGLLHLKLGKMCEALHDFSTILAAANVSGQQRSQALFNRGVVRQKEGNVALAIADYTSAYAISEASTHTRAQAIFNRGIVFAESSDPERASVDFTTVLEIPEISSNLRVLALFNRAIAYDKCGVIASALRDYAAVLAMPDVPAEKRARTLLNRSHLHSRQGDNEMALRDHAEVLVTAGALTDDIAETLLTRGCIYLGERRFGAALDDFSAALRFKDISENQTATAHILSGWAHFYLGKRPAARSHVEIGLKASELVEKIRAIGERLMRELDHADDQTPTPPDEAP